MFQKDVFSDQLKDVAVDVIHLPLQEFSSPWKTFKHWHSALKPFHGARAILCRGVGGATSLSVLVALRLRFKRLYTIEHALANLFGSKGLSIPISRKVKNFLACKMVYRSIAVSEATRKSVIDVYGFKPFKIRTCYNWVDTEHFKPNLKYRADIQELLGIESDCFLVGFVGRLVKEKPE